MTPAEQASASVVPASRKALCVVYVLIAVAALVATWSQNVAYLGKGARFLVEFIDASKVTPASRSMSADALLVALSAVVLMVIEARRVDVKYVWLYVAGAFVTAISVTFPLFLIARELRMGTSDAPRLGVMDTILLAVVAVGTAVWTVWVDVG